MKYLAFIIALLALVIVINGLVTLRAAFCEAKPTLKVCGNK